MAALEMTSGRDRLRERWTRLRARVLGDGLAGRLVRGSLWSVVGIGISRTLTMAAAILVARMMGKEKFGEFGIVRTTVDMFGTLAGLGLALTASKHVAEYRQSDPKRAGDILGISSAIATVSGAIMTVALFLASDWLATNALSAPQLSPLL